MNRRASLFHGYRMLKKSGNFDNLRLAAGLTQGEYRGYLFLDSDVYKWLEAASLELARSSEADLARLVDQTIALLAAAQQPDGYLNSYYQVAKPGERWTDLDHGHELYCAGHLLEAGLARQRATGKGDLLAIARRFADHIAAVFGSARLEAACGHPEIELALVELFRECGERSYLDLAKFFIDQRGRGRMRGYGMFGPEYHQDRLPVRQAVEVEGHAVRQLYLAAGVTDLYLETGEAALLEAALRLWDDMSTRKAYLTGGYGSRAYGEAFGESYQLPSRSAYCETCAAIAGMMWGWRMLLATGEARFADMLERTLYNGFLSGVSLDGCHFFYVNPLQSDGAEQRKEWYACACCPPNVMRQLALVDHYLATFNEQGVQLHQYASGRIDFQPVLGAPLALRIETGYPWDGRVKITLEESDERQRTLDLRLPGWSQQTQVLVNGQPQEGHFYAGDYARLRRVWRAGDIVELSFSMSPRLVAAHPYVEELHSSLAIERGPLVYCLEGADQDNIPHLAGVCIDPQSPLEERWLPDQLGGVVTVEARGGVLDLSAWQGRLYRPALDPTQFRPQKLTAIPYYAWANRGAHPMRVWIPRLP